MVLRLRELPLCLALTLTLGACATATSGVSSREPHYSCMTLSKTGGIYQASHENVEQARRQVVMECVHSETKKEDCAVKSYCRNTRLTESEASFTCRVFGSDPFDGLGLSRAEASEAALQICVEKDGVDGIEACEASEPSCLEGS
jgi:hypothetical protein